MRSTPSVRSFPNVAFETVPMFVWLRQPFRKRQLSDKQWNLTNERTTTIGNTWFLPVFPWRRYTPLTERLALINCVTLRTTDLSWPSLPKNWPASADHKAAVLLGRNDVIWPPWTNRGLCWFSSVGLLTSQISLCYVLSFEKRACLENSNMFCIVVY